MYLRRVIEIMAKRKKEPEHIFLGGAIGEWAYCANCGEGLNIGKQQRIEIFTAALRAFGDIHRDCRKTWHEPEPKNMAEWMTSRFVGVSSATILHTVFGYPDLYDRHDVPHDYADFSRCVKLLSLPLDPLHIRDGDSNEEIFLKSGHILRPDKWARIIKNWRALKELFDAATVSGDASEFNEFLGKI